jgi:hypothetical protein
VISRLVRNLDNVEDHKIPLRGIQNSLTDLGRFGLIRNGVAVTSGLLAKAELPQLWVLVINAARLLSVLVDS